MNTRTSEPPLRAAIKETTPVWILLLLGACTSDAWLESGTTLVAAITTVLAARWGVGQYKKQKAFDLGASWHERLNAALSAYERHLAKLHATLTERRIDAGDEHRNAAAFYDDLVVAIDSGTHLYAESGLRDRITQLPTQLRAWEKDLDWRTNQERWAQCVEGDRGRLAEVGTLVRRDLAKLLERERLPS